MPQAESAQALQLEPASGGSPAHLLTGTASGPGEPATAIEVQATAPGVPAITAGVPVTPPGEVATAPGLAALENGKPDAGAVEGTGPAVEGVSRPFYAFTRQAAEAEAASR